jgi:TolB-like protein/class 3 adenylate cyclase/Flp pilus assembly protein TadD
VNAQDTPAEAKPDLPLEIAHILLIDVVGYSKLLVNEQIELLQELKQIVRSSESFQAAEARDELIRVPTGDGMALVFFHSPEEPARCALEISRALHDHPSIQLRMGVHSGPVNRVIDVNEKTNIAGSGINVAQRVLDCGDAGHILLSAHVAEDLAEYRHWQPHLHDLGECEVKYGLRLHLFNLYKDGFGNPQVPEKLRRGRRKHAPAVSVRPFTAPRLPKVVLLVAVVASAVALVISSLIFLNRAPPTTVSRALNALAAIPEKSIAVLPFENLSNEKENAYFADGVQDEILTGLSRVADLKVISRTSVMQYKAGPKRNLREVATDLGVAHVLEGTVQRAGGRVRVNAQLIDARTDSQLWAERYDRDVADVFAIESELAGKIVAQLQAKISPSEKAAIEQKPTTDLVAHDLYIRAKTLIATAVWSTPLQESLFEAVRLLNQAIERDPAFALAYYQLADAHDLIYFAGLDHTPARLALADAAIQSLTRLLPDSGEAHLALAKHLYWGYHDYDHAREELKLAQQSLPNDPLSFEILGFIDRRQGRWAGSTKNLERAVELDPQNPRVLQQISYSYYLLHRYADEERALDRAIAVTPKEGKAVLRASRAEVELDWHADPRPLLSTAEAIASEAPREVKNIAKLWLRGSLCRRDFDSALRALAALPAAGCYEDAIPFPRAWCEGVVAQMRGDKAAAHAAFTSTRTEAAKLVAEQPDYPEGLCVLGVADAALGNKEDAIREGRRAVELLPVTKDAIIGPLLVQNLALIYAWTGEKDLAFEQLTIAAKLPGFLSYGELRLHPYWDPLRGDPRFDKIVASLAPK